MFKININYFITSINAILYKSVEPGNKLPE